MIIINSITIKNFLSIGNVAQSINFHGTDLVLVLGENIDLGGNDNRNGVGKSAIVNALSYGLFGVALTKIRKDNLINATNQKNMVVTVDFDVNGKKYKVIRGRKPNIFKFIKDGNDDDTSEKTDEAQGENSNTQREIEQLLGITPDLFSHLVALNTYVEPFLALRTNDQRIIIEQLLGITKLSEKADKLKDDARITKDLIKEEEFKLSAATEANKRIEQNITALNTKSVAWESNKITKIEKTQDAIVALLNVDIDNEIVLHKSKKEVEDLTSEFRSLTRELNGLEKDVADTTKVIARLSSVLESSVEKICPTCLQEMDKDTHIKVHNEYVTQHADADARLAEKVLKRNETKALTTTVASMIPKLPGTFYNTIDEAYKHKTTLDTLGNTLSTELETVNPYIEQATMLKQDGLQEINFSELNKLSKLRDHQEFLLKLLTNKDSFIRKKIIDQNLAFLNHRLAHYLTNIGLPHLVKFKSDLEVEISMYGKEFDFDNLSRGERTRLILSLSWSFRDVFENMNNKINLLFVDELLDQGLDSSGVESSVGILKTMCRENNRNIYLISHRDELVGRIPNVLKVIKEGGFTSLSSGDATS